MSKTATHTPGPWEASNCCCGDGNSSIQISHSSRPDGSKYRLIAKLSMPWNGDPSDEDQANARLIAAAPLLVATLRECAKQLRQLDCPGHADMAQHAIAKATD